MSCSRCKLRPCLCAPTSRSKKGEDSTYELPSDRDIGKLFGEYNRNPFPPVRAFNPGVGGREDAPLEGLRAGMPASPAQLIFAPVQPDPAQSEVAMLDLDAILAAPAQSDVAMLDLDAILAAAQPDPLAFLSAPAQPDFAMMDLDAIIASPTQPDPLAFLFAPDFASPTDTQLDLDCGKAVDASLPDSAYESSFSVSFMDVDSDDDC